MDTKVEGLVEPGFEEVADTFLSNFADHGEVGAAYCAHVEGRKVVDIWAGSADPVTDRPWAEDTVVLVFSTTKGGTATCANLLAQRDLLDVDAPVAKYWPEFAKAGKEAIPVRWILSHKAGLPYVDVVLSLEEVLAWEPLARALEEQAPIWPPGTAYGYHAITWGVLVGELVRRISGLSLGQFFAQEVAGPLGLDFWIGLPQEHKGQVAPLIGSLFPGSDDPKSPRSFGNIPFDPNSILVRTTSLNGLFPDLKVWDSDAVRAAEVPGGNAITNARSISRMYAALIGDLLDGTKRLLTQEQVEAASTPQTEGSDMVLGTSQRFGLGYAIASRPNHGAPSGTPPPFAPIGSFGHGGGGGSLGFADPHHGIAAGYVMNRMWSAFTPDPRARSLVEATYTSAGFAMTDD